MIVKEIETNSNHSLYNNQHETQVAGLHRLQFRMEAFFQLLSLFIIPHLCQTRPGALVCGRVGDQPKAAAFPAESASTDVIELTSTSSPSAVTLEDGRYAWGPVEVEAEAASEETLFPVSAASASAAPLLSASPDVIELTG